MPGQNHPPGIKARAMFMAAFSALLSASGTADARPTRLAQSTSTANQGFTRALLQAGTAAPDTNDYAALLGFSYFFYEAQQSGVLPGWNRASRANGGWRGDSHLSDGQGPDTPGVDLTGGLYDAGDHLKLHLPLGSSLGYLALGMLSYEGAYRGAGQWDTGARSLERAAQYLVKCHLQASNDPAGNVFVAQVGDVDTDHSYWGRPEQQPQLGPRGTQGWRPVWTISPSTPGSDILGQAASALISTSLVLTRPGAYNNPGLAADLQTRARQLLGAAAAYRGTWAPPTGSNAYPSSGYADELALGYLWLCKLDLSLSPGTTPASCGTALSFWDAAYSSNPQPVNWDWDQAIGGAAALLLSLRGSLAGVAGASTRISQATSVLSHFTSVWQDTSRKCPLGDFNLCYTPGGLAWLTQWGSLRHTSNIALLTSLFSTFLGADVTASPAATRRTNRCWARGQLQYILGANPRGVSYVVGYHGPAANEVSPERPHHRSSSCPVDPSLTCDFSALNAAGPNPSTLLGALVGGPSSDDSYVDNRQDYVRNEVALDYNAGFTGALAALYDTSLRLGAAGCSWATYCSGGCDSLDESNTFASLTPAPVTSTPAPTTSPAPTPATGSTTTPTTTSPPLTSSPVTTPARSPSPPPPLPAASPIGGSPTGGPSQTPSGSSSPGPTPSQSPGSAGQGQGSGATQPPPPPPPPPPAGLNPPPPPPPPRQ